MKGNQRASIYQICGDILQKASHKNKALAYYRKAIELDGRGQWKNYRNISRILFDEGRSRKAGNILRAGMELYPDNLELLTDYTAFFTLEIPIDEGPYKFKGLPGLIVKVEDAQRQHVFTLTGVEKITYKQPIYFVKQNNVIAATPQEYVKAFNLHTQDFLARVQNPNKFKFNSDEAKSKVIRRLKKRNNFIEKY